MAGVGKPFAECCERPGRSDAYLERWSNQLGSPRSNHAKARVFRMDSEGMRFSAIRSAGSTPDKVGRACGLGRARTIRDDLARKKPLVGKLARIECGIDACNVVACYDDWRNACSAAFCFTVAGFSASSKRSNRENLPQRVPNAGKSERIVRFEDSGEDGGGKTVRIARGRDVGCAPAQK